MKNLWHIIELLIQKGTVSLWIICGGGILLCIIGGLADFLTSDDIVKIFLGLIAAYFAMAKRSPNAPS